MKYLLYAMALAILFYPRDPVAADGGTLRKDSNYRSAFSRNIAGHRSSVVRVYSGSSLVASGTVVGVGTVVTRASALTDTVRCEGGGKSRDAKVVQTDAGLDLAALLTDTTGLTPVEWANPAVGDLVALAPPEPDGPVPAVVETPPAKGPGFLGLDLTGPNSTKISKLVPDGPAAKAGMKVGDVIQTFDGKPVTTHQQLLTAVRAKSAGDVVQVKVKRGEEVAEFKVTLGTPPSRPQPQPRRGPGGPPAGPREKRTSFSHSFQHDAIAPTSYAGAPLFNLDGKAVGIHASRGGRVESYAIPARAVQDFVGSVPSR